MTRPHLTAWRATLRCLPLAALLAFLAPAALSAAAPAPAPYLIALQDRARALHLAEQPMWRTLVHYKVHPLTRHDRSLADDPDFFLHPQGATQPAAELDATLAAFFDPAEGHALNQSAACRFIARFEWLREQLAFDPAQLPEPACPRYRQWRAGIQAERVTLIFPSAYLNSPASMYGHTFLRLDPPVSRGTASPLLSYAVSYAASGNESEGLAFALKGLTGLYPGEFTNSPYYLRIRDYNDLENRDIWEYELKLSPPEIERLLAHTWELGPTRFDYYFFDENCSYHLLSLLDAARPGLNLTDRFTWWAIPLDTVKAVAATPGLLGAVRFRPSNASEMRHRAALLGPQRSALAQALSQGQLAPTDLTEREPDPARRALILETAERLATYDGSRGLSTEALTQQKRMALLTARAGLPTGEPLTVPTPVHEPTVGHGTARVDMMVGQRDGQGLVELSARPAYHELLDPEDGYQRGAAIQFFRLAFSKSAQGHVQLERFTPVEIASLSPREPLLSARSWRVDIGLQRSAVTRPDGQRPLGLSLRGGPGYAWELGGAEATNGGGTLGYAFLDNHAAWDRSLDHRPWAAGTGLATGLLADLGRHWRVQAEVFARAYLARQPVERGANLASRWRLNADWNLHGRCELRQRAGSPVSHLCLLGAQRYW